MNVAYDVAINVISGLIAGAITSAVTIAYLRTREWLRARRVWRLEEPLGLSVIVSTSMTPRHLEGAQRPGTGVGQLRGVAVLAPSLIRGYGARLRPDMILLSGDADPEDIEGDVILLGGPRTNSVAQKLCAVEGLPVYMRDAPRMNGEGPVDSRVHWAPPGGEVEVFDTADEGEWAYGLVLRHSNVLVPESPGRLWFIGGSSTFGTQAAAEWLIGNQELVRKAEDTMGVVVRARLVSDPPTTIRAPECWRMVSYA